MQNKSSINHEITTLPYFRIAGLSIKSHQHHYADDLAKLWQKWQNPSLPNGQSPKDALSAFSRSIYCVYHDYASDADFFSITLGKLVPTEYELPDWASDVWIPPQNYAVYMLPENHIQAASALFQVIDKDETLPRNKRFDFECYPLFGVAKLYIGLMGDVKMEEVE